MEVAFSKYSQPIVFRIIKYIVIALLVLFLWGTNLLWMVLGSMFTLGLILHFWFRYKTKGWTQSYGMWKHERDRDIKHMHSE